MLKVGKDDPIEVDYLSGDTTAAGRVASPGTNTARQYEAFAGKGGDVVTFEDALKNQRLLKRIANSAGWEM